MAPEDRVTWQLRGNNVLPIGSVKQKTGEELQAPRTEESTEEAGGSWRERDPETGRAEGTAGAIIYLLNAGGGKGGEDKDQGSKL